MILLLGGTGEGRALAHLIAAEGWPATVSLAGATREAAALPLPTRVGGFGGAQGFRKELTELGVQVIVDATHPFAARISHRTARIAAETSIPYLQVLREPWVSGPQDNWTILRHEAEAALHIPRGARAFLATGRQTLPAFGNLEGRYLYCRQIDPPDGPFPFEGEYIVGRPPFSVDDEVALFGRLGIDWLVVKNAGGAASATKLIAARRLGIPVAMIARPAQPDAPRVATVEEAMAWLSTRI
ncbi:MAG: cobalt-precorrin-6A reductase [Shimia sp.]